MYSRHPFRSRSHTNLKSVQAMSTNRVGPSPRLMKSSTCYGTPWTRRSLLPSLLAYLEPARIRENHMMRSILRSIVERRTWWAFLVLLGLDFVVSISVLFSTNQPISMQFGNNLQPFNPHEIARDVTISSWFPNNFGMPSPGYNMGILYVYLVQTIFQDPWSSQWVMIFTPFWLSSLTMFLFLSKGRLTDSATVLTAGGLVYTYNWLTLQYMGNHMMMYAYAAFPLVLLCAVRVTLDEGAWWVNSGLFAAALTLGTMFYTVAGVSYMLPFLLAGFLFWMILSRKSIYSIAKSLGTIVLGFGIFFVITLGFSLPVLLGVLTLGVAGYASSAKLVVPINDFLYYLNPYYFETYLPVQIAPLLVLTLPTSQGFLLAMGLLISFIGSLSLISSKERIKVMSIGLWISFLLSLLMATLIQQRSPLVQAIYGSIPFIWPINSADVYILFFGGLLSVLFAFGIQVVTQGTRRFCRMMASRRFLKILVVAIYVVGIFIMTSAPLLSRNAVLVRPESFTSGEVASSYPGYVRGLANSFNQERESAGPFRVLWVPQSNRVNFLMQSNDIYSDFAPSSIPSEVHQKIVTLASTIRNYQSYDIGRELALLGFRYVVVLRDASGEGPVRVSTGGIDTYLTGAPSSFESFFDSSTRDIQLVQRTQSYSVYVNKFVSQDWHGMLFATRDIQVLNSTPSILQDSSALGDDHQWGEWNARGNSSAAPTAHIAVTIDPSQPVNGSASLLWQITSGGDGKVDSGIWRWLSPPLNLSSRFLSMYLYGAGQKGLFNIILSTDDATDSYHNIAEWDIRDDFQGWSHVILSVDHPSRIYGAWNSTYVHGILIKYFGEGFAPYEQMNVRINQVIQFAPIPEEELNLESMQILAMSPTYAPTKFTVEVNAPSWLVFLQNYDSGWGAYVANGASDGKLDHVKAVGWANAFRVTGNGPTKVILIYEPQIQRDRLILLWSLGIVGLFLIPILSFLFRKNGTKDRMAKLFPIDTVRRLSRGGGPSPRGLVGKMKSNRFTVVEPRRSSEKE